jgi:hypothetical protein
VPSRTRLLAWLGGVALVAGAVVLLRTTDDEPAAARPDSVQAPVRITQFAAANVVLPQPGERPATPVRLIARPGPARLLLSWNGGVPGSAAAASVTGYEVRWSASGKPTHTRLVIAPDTQLDDLTADRTYRVEVRGVDAFGRRSRPAALSAATGGDGTWRDGLTGLLADFTDPASHLTEVPGSHWHLSGYRGCVDLGPGAVDDKGLPIDLGCGADMAVLRARAPIRLITPPGPDGVLGRVVLLTDTAAPGGELTIDLVPGPADRVGAGRALTGTAPDLALPPGTIRAVVNDSGAHVRAGAGVPTVESAVTLIPAPRRGPGALHRFEVLLTTSGVRVLQDGALVADGGYLPPWPEASVLLGFRGPDGQRARVHLAAAGFTGPASPVPDVAEVPVSPGTRRVLQPNGDAPNIGIARTPLVAAASARLVSTITTATGLDPAGVVVQLGDRTIAARPATPSPPAPGSAFTVIADIPPDLINGPPGDPLTPFVLRAPGAGDGVSVLESYLEITPGPQWTAHPQPNQSNTDPRRPAPDALPKVDLTMTNSSGNPLPSTTVRGQGQVILAIDLNAANAQWDSGGVAGVQGFELWLDGHIAAALPTAADGPGLGGHYPVSLALSGISPGPHILEVREFGPEQPVSLLRDFAVLPPVR